MIGGGDLNENFGSRHPVVQSKFADYGFVNAKSQADVTDPRSTLPGRPKRGADGKFHGVPGNTEGPKRCWLDHVLYTPETIHAKKHAVVIDQDALDASDHSPVLVDFELR